MRNRILQPGRWESISDESVSTQTRIDCTRVLTEDTKGKETREGVCNVRSSVEDGQTAGKLSSAVEGGQVVDDEREKGRLGHSWTAY